MLRPVDTNASEVADSPVVTERVDKPRQATRSRCSATGPTGRVLPRPAGRQPEPLAAAFSGAVAGAADALAGNELWFTDGTAAGTRRVADSLAGVGSTSPTQIAVVGSRVFYRGYSQLVGVELMVSDDTLAGTFVVADLATPIADATPRELTKTSSGVVFGAIEAHCKQ